MLHLWWFVHIYRSDGGYQDDDKSHGMKTFKVRAELLSSGKRAKLCF